MPEPTEQRIANCDTHLTSIVVHARPDAVATVANAIDSMAEAEVHVASPTGKIVVTLETETLHQVTERIDDVNRLPGVINAFLVYHQIEATDSLDDKIELNAPTAAPTPKVTS